MYLGNDIFVFRDLQPAPVCKYQCCARTELLFGDFSVWRSNTAEVVIMIVVENADGRSHQGNLFFQLWYIESFDIC